MDFNWNDEQKQLYDSTVDFARKKLALDPRDFDSTEALFREGWHQCGRQGIQASILPEAYGGSALDALSATLLMEALGYGCRDMGLLFAIGAHIFACITPLLQFGGEHLGAAYLSKMGSGELIATHAATELGAGSDIFSMRTRAERSGDHYVLNGNKCYATNAPIADLFLILAVTDPNRGILGISAFLVEKNTPGLSVSKPRPKTGLRSALMGDVFLKDCVVSLHNRIGEEGQGGMLFMHSMNWERVCLVASYLGAMERQLEETIAFARERKQFGQPIKAFQAVSHKIVDMKIRLEAARLLTYRSGWLLSRHSPALVSLNSAMSKIMLTESAVQSSLDAIQIHGGLGVMSDYPIEGYLHDALPSRIFSGTTEVLRNAIAKRLQL